MPIPPPPTPPNTVAIYAAAVTDGYTTPSILSSNIAYCFGDAAAPGTLVLQESPDEVTWVDAQTRTLMSGIFDMSAITAQHVRALYLGGDNVLTLFLNSA